MAKKATRKAPNGSSRCHQTITLSPASRSATTLLALESAKSGWPSRSKVNEHHQRKIMIVATHSGWCSSMPPSIRTTPNCTFTAW